MADTQQGASAPVLPGWQAAQEAKEARRRARKRAWVLLAAGLAFVLPAATVLILWRLSFQPITIGGIGQANLAYPGLPAGRGIHEVNTFGNVHQDFYVPPQEAGYTFYLFVNIENDGSRTVTIESAVLPKGPLNPAGATLFSLPGSGFDVMSPVTHVLRNAPLGPSAPGIFLAIPARSWPCVREGDAFNTVPGFVVTYRWLFFTHTVTIPWSFPDGQLVLQLPLSSGGPGVVCPGRG